jgi:CheY-like chemotaxis protein
MTVRRPVTVLVGDDEPLLRRLAARILAPLGYDVLLAADAEDAVRIVRSAPALDLVVLDANLPPRGAAEALREIRTLRPAVGVIVTSGEGPGADLAREIAASGGPFLRKPFSAEALVSALEAALARARQA